MEPGVCVSSARGESASQAVTKIISARLARDFKIDEDANNKNYDPGSVTTSLCKKGPGGSFILEAIRIEIGLEEKTLKRDKIVEDLADIVGLINRNLGYSEGDQGTGHTLG